MTLPLAASHTPAPPPAVKLESAWPVLGGIVARFAVPLIFLVSLSLLTCLAADTYSPRMALEWLDSLSLLVCHPFGSGNAAIILSMLPNSLRVRCASANSSQ